MVPKVGPDFEPQKLFAAISQLGLGKAPTLDQKFRGGQCYIFKLSFRDKKSLSVRILLYTSVHNQLNKIPIVKAEAPKCRRYSLSFNNPIKHPFIALTWVEGSSLAWSENSPMQPHRDNLLGQIASIQLSLIECTLETRTAYFKRILKNRHTRVKKGRLPDISNKDCINQQGLLDNVLGQDQNNTVFAIDHSDLKPSNIIVDDKYTIQGVIDWEFAAFVPIIRAAGIPYFLWPDGPHFRPSAVVQKDRKSYALSFASQHSPAALYMQRWQIAENVDFHTLYIKSLFIEWKIPSHRVVQNRKELSSANDTEDE
ncbi:hypothetical protein GGR51DRAFT_550772 [Nemania sp. FL0031]|nr:hypothetical protein GGR51DRAFT_550772 [Nemania sp. FL0031]